MDKQREGDLLVSKQYRFIQILLIGIALSRHGGDRPDVFRMKVFLNFSQKS